MVDFPLVTHTKVDREFAAKNACDDWVKDNDGCGTMTHDRFVDSLFELVRPSLFTPYIVPEINLGPPCHLPVYWRQSQKKAYSVEHPLLFL